jgi:death-on-curing protein
MRFLTIERVIAIHDYMIMNYGGLNGIRDVGLLASAIEMPKATMFGEYLHPSIYDKAAAYLYHIIGNHPFIDANKRTGSASALIFLDMNNIELSVNEAELEELVVRTAQGQTEKAEISKFFEASVR